MPAPEAPLTPPPLGIPVAPSLAATLSEFEAPPPTDADRERVVFISAIAIVIAAAAALAAQVLMRLIGLITNLAFYGRAGTQLVSPAGHHLGYAVVLVPIIGG